MDWYLAVSADNKEQSQVEDTDGSCTTECVSGDWSAEVKQENLEVVKQEPDDVCCVAYFCNIYSIMTAHPSIIDLFLNIDNIPIPPITS